MREVLPGLSESITAEVLVAAQLVETFPGLSEAIAAGWSEAQLVETFPGLVESITVEESSGPTVPVLASNCLTYLHADSGPVGTPSTAVGNAVTDWISLTDATGGGGPYDWEQTGAGDRGVIDETAFSGGRRSVLFDGSSDHMVGDAAIAPLFQGTQIPFTRFLQAVMVSQKLSYLMAFGDTASSSRYELARDSTSAQTELTVMSRGTLNPGVLNGGTVANEEFVMVDIKHGANRTVWIVTAGGGAVKVVDNQPMDAGNITSLNTVALAAWLTTGVISPSNIAVRRHGIWDVAFNDTQSGVLTDLFGT